MTGIILAGGKSSRMGEDKSFLEIDGRPLIEIVLSKMSELFPDILVVTNTPALYQVYQKKYQAQILEDVIPHQGPLGGIQAGLKYSKTEYSFVVGCDMPFIQAPLVQYMIKKIVGFDAAVIKYQQLFQPLCACYSKSCLRVMDQQLAKKRLKLGDLLNCLHVNWLGEEEIGRYDPQGLSFVNINTPQEYQKYKQ